MKTDIQLIIIQPNLRTGGIETYFALLMSKCVECGAHVVWLHDDSAIIDPGMKGYLAGVEQIPFRTRHLHRFIDTSSKITYHKYVTIICSYINFLVYAEVLAKNLKRLYPGIVVNEFYFMPHFTGYSQFPDTAFPRPINKIIYKKYNKVLNKWIERSEYAFFSERHYCALCDHYAVSLGKSDAQFVPQVRDINKFDMRSAKRKAASRDSIFKIVGSGRFDFPHKGFLMGLIDEFEKIKKDFPQADLTLVGDGPGKNELMRRIESCNDTVKNSIHLTGMVSPAELKTILASAHLSVGVAGSLMEGALAGTLSIPVRHYTYDCESPGYLSQKSEEKTLVTKSCSDALPLIVAAITMSDEEYCARSHDSYVAAVGLYGAENASGIFDLSNNKSAEELSPSERRFILFCMRFIGVRSRFTSVRKRFFGSGSGE